jgi:hypothetical protein
MSELVHCATSTGGDIRLPVGRYCASYSTAQVLGYDESAIKDDDTLQARTSANPNHQWYWHVVIRAVDDSSTIAGMFYCKVEYDIEFFDRLDTLLDLNSKIFMDLKRLESRAKRDNDVSKTKESKTKVIAVSELLNEFKDQFLLPGTSTSCSRDDGRSEISDRIPFSHVVVPSDSHLSHDIGVSVDNVRFGKPKLSRSSGL